MTTLALAALPLALWAQSGGGETTPQPQHRHGMEAGQHLHGMQGKHGMGGKGMHGMRHGHQGQMHGMQGMQGMHEGGMPGGCHGEQAKPAG